MNENIDFRLPIYDIDISEDDLGLTAVSLVENPAIKTDFVFFKEEKTPIYLDEEQHNVVGCLLIPNQLIYRVGQNLEQFYIRWTKESIEEAAWKFVSNGLWNNVSLFHNGETVNGVNLLRLWITDSEEDEINTHFGFNLPIGSLCAMYHIENEDIWQMIKQGDIKGFSIEAFANLILK